jgi:hypothetical protein
VFVQLDAPVSADLPLATGAGITAPARLLINGMGASDTGSSSEETQVDHQFVSYNGFLAFRVVANNTTAGDDTATHVFDPGGSNYNGPTAAGEDASLEAVTFNLATGTVSAPVLLHLTTPVSSPVDTLRNDADFLHTLGTAFSDPQQDTFGPDEGLANIVMFAAETDDDPDDSKLDAVQATVLAVYEVDASTGGLLEASAVSVDDPSISDPIDSRLVSARISRNGDYVMLGWLQREAGGVADAALKVAEYLTTRPASDGTFTIPPLASTLSAPVTVNADTDGIGVAGFAFQDNLGYICGAQSDPDVMNIAYAHPDAVTDRLFVGRVVADLITPVAPVVTTSLLEVDDQYVYSLGNLVNDAGFAYKITDSGEGGNVFAVYNADVDPTSGTDIRVFSERTGLSAGAGPIDSNEPFREAGFQDFTLIATPAGQDIGVFDPVAMQDSEFRPHGSQLIHVLFREQKSSKASGLGFALRTRVFDTSDNGLSFGDSFFPGAGTAFVKPFDLDLPLVDPGLAEDAELRGIAVDGFTVGIWYTELGHIYYQEYNPDVNFGWVTTDGVSNPLLVDDDTNAETSSNEPVGFFYLFVTSTCSCSDLHGATVFYSKTADDFSSAERIHVRSRE